MIIGLSGYAGSGKSTAARYLIEQHNFVLVKFAAPLKSMLRALGLGDRELEGDLKETPSDVLSGRTPRHAMQTLGTEWGRDTMHPDFWVNAAMLRVNQLVRDGRPVVMDDVRFLNETAAIREAKGAVVNIFRPGVVPSSGHLSENISLPQDYVIRNDGTVDWLNHQLYRLVISLSAGTDR